MLAERELDLIADNIASNPANSSIRGVLALIYEGSPTEAHAQAADKVVSEMESAGLQVTLLGSPFEDKPGVTEVTICYAYDGKKTLSNEISERVQVKRSRAQASVNQTNATLPHEMQALARTRDAHIQEIILWLSTKIRENRNGSPWKVDFHAIDGVPVIEIVSPVEAQFPGLTISYDRHSVSDKAGYQLTAAIDPRCQDPGLDRLRGVLPLAEQKPRIVSKAGGQSRRLSTHDQARARTLFTHLVNRVAFELAKNPQKKELIFEVVYDEPETLVEEVLRDLMASDRMKVTLQSQLIQQGLYVQTKICLSNLDFSTEADKAIQGEVERILEQMLVSKQADSARVVSSPSPSSSSSSAPLRLSQAPQLPAAVSKDLSAYLTELISFVQEGDADNYAKGLQRLMDDNKVAIPEKVLATLLVLEVNKEANENMAKVELLESLRKSLKPSLK